MQTNKREGQPRPVAYRKNRGVPRRAADGGRLRLGLYTPAPVHTHSARNDCVEAIAANQGRFSSCSGDSHRILNRSPTRGPKTS